MKSSSNRSRSFLTSLTLSLMALGIGGAGLALAATGLSLAVLTFSNLVFGLLAIVGFTLAGLLAGALLGGLVAARLWSGQTPAQLARWFWQGGRPGPAPIAPPTSAAPALAPGEALSGDDFCLLLGDAWGWAPAAAPDEQTR